MSAQFAILSPCQKRWSDLCGDGRKRFCDECQTYVHVLDEYSLQEFQDLKRESRERVCGYLVGESHPGPRSRRAILLGAVLTAISPLLAQSGRVLIRVTDATGAMVPGAQVSLLGENGKPLRSLQTDERGETVFNDLPIGNSQLRVYCLGFKRLPLTVTVRSSDEVRVAAKLEIATMGGAVTRRPHRWWQILR